MLYINWVNKGVVVECTTMDLDATEASIHFLEKSIATSREDILTAIDINTRDYARILLYKIYKQPENSNRFFVSKTNQRTVWVG